MKMLLALLMLFLPAAQAEMDVTREWVVPDTLVPGQPVTLAITFWTDSWFNPPPTWPAMEMVNGNMLTATPPNQLVSRQMRGMSWSGVRLERKVTAWDQGTLRLPAMAITLQSAGQAPKTVSLPKLEKTVSWPADVQQPDRFLPATRLSLQQQWRTYTAAADQQLHVGDVIERTVILQAMDVTPSQIPQLLYAIPGSETQRLTPQNSALTQGRGEQVGIQRVERLRYLPSQPGEILMPPVKLRWWDTQHQQWQQAELPGAHYRFAPARTAGSEKVLQAAATSSWGSKLLWLLAAVMIIAVLWFCRRLLLRGGRYVLLRIRFLCRVLPLPNLTPDRKKP